MLRTSTHDRLVVLALSALSASKWAQAFAAARRGDRTALLVAHYAANGVDFLRIDADTHSALERRTVLVGATRAIWEMNQAAA